MRNVLQRSFYKKKKHLFADLSLFLSVFLFKYSQAKENIYNYSLVSVSLGNSVYLYFPSTCDFNSLSKPINQSHSQLWGIWR